MCLTASAQFLSSKQGQSQSSATYKTGFRTFLLGGYTFGNKDGARAELLASLGDQLNNYLFIGGGAGTNYYTDSNYDLFTIPVFANVRGYIPVKSSVRPFVDLKTGYGICTKSEIKGGTYFNATAGIEISNFTIGIGYSSQVFSIDGVSDDYYHISVDDYSFSSGGLTLNLGVSF